MEREKRERQLPLGADPSSGEQTFLTEFLLYVHIHPVIISLFFFFFFWVGSLLIFFDSVWRRKRRSYVHTRIRGDRASLNVKRIKPRCFSFFSFSARQHLRILYEWCGVLFSRAIGYWKACIQIHGQSRRRPNSP